MNIIGLLKPLIKEFIISLETELTEIKKIKKYEILNLDEKTENYDDFC